MANDMVKIGLIVGGAYLVGKYVFGFDPLAGLFGGTPVSTVATSPQAANPSGAALVDTKSMVIAAAKAAGTDPNSLQTVDVWNYYYSQVRGVAGPDPSKLFANNVSGEKYSIDEWWAAMTKNGFSGMGAIAHYTNPYMNWQGTGFGHNLIPMGSEKYIKSF